MQKLKSNTPLGFKNLSADHYIYTCMRAKLLKSRLTLCEHMGHGPPGSSVHGILQARTLEWVVMPSSGDLPDPGIKPTSLTSPVLAGRTCYH